MTALEVKCFSVYREHSLGALKSVDRRTNKEVMVESRKSESHPPPARREKKRPIHQLIDGRPNSTGLSTGGTSVLPELLLQKVLFITSRADGKPLPSPRPASPPNPPPRWQRKPVCCECTGCQHRMFCKAVQEGVPVQGAGPAVNLVFGLLSGCTAVWNACSAKGRVRIEA